jgi:hypothetical protein
MMKSCCCRLAVNNICFPSDAKIRRYSADDSSAVVTMEDLRIGDTVGTD